MLKQLHANDVEIDSCDDDVNWCETKTDSKEPTDIKRRLLGYIFDSSKCS